jgi:poly-beta-hydroxyalkanoate depolymerase
MANEQNLRPIQKGEVRNPNGRPRKFVSALKEQGYKASEVNDAIQVLMSMTIDELKDVYNNPQATVLEKTVASAIRKSIEKGSLYSIETLLTRVYGKPKEQVDLNASGGMQIEVVYKDANSDSTQ